ncbi:MAG: ATP-binding protein [Chloroflexi bacterium]|nr:ATP-binding protein [Chloroflexota bacterium]
MDYLKIGTAKGPGDHPHEFLFITPDEDGACKIGEFVFYMLDGVDGRRTVLGRIIRRAPVRLFPDSFMASPEVSPAEIAAAVGYVDEEDELFEVSVAVMGHFDPHLNAFVNPRVLPRSGSAVYLAPNDMLAEVLSRRKLLERGSAHVGSLLSRAPGDVPVVLDVNEFTSTHLSIIAGTGSGKSYLAGVAVEELMKPCNKACVLIADPHGEYETLLEMQNDPAFVDGSYRPKVRVLKPHQIKVRMANLTLDDVRYLLPTLGERMEWILTEAFNRMRRLQRGTFRGSGGARGPAESSGSPYDREWTIDDLINAVRDVDQEYAAKNVDYSSSVQGLIWRLDRRFRKSPTFDDYEHLDLNHLFQAGQCTVLQLNEIDQRDQQVIVATLLRRLLEARMGTEKGQIPADDERYVPYPAFVLLEEAHHFAPASADVISTTILKQVLSEGRKFGVGVGLISQRPGKLDQDVLSQCMTHCIMRIVNPVDQASIAGAVESVGRDLLDELPALSKGQVIIAGSSLNTPVLCQTRSRHTRHGGTSMSAAEEWEKHFRGRGERERDARVVDFQATRSRIYRDE